MKILNNAEGYQLPRSNHPGSQVQVEGSRYGTLIHSGCGH